MSARKIFITFFTLGAIIIIGVSGIFLWQKREVGAGRIVLKDGNLYSIGNSLGNKNLITNGDIKIIFSQEGGKILYGKGWEGDIPDSERQGGTRLWIINEDGSDARYIPADDLIVYAFLDVKNNRVFYSTRNQDLYSTDMEGKNQIKIKDKVLSPNLSPDGRFIAYQKLNPDWQPGDYYDRALGITVLNLNTGSEFKISDDWEDFNPFWTPDGKKILFFSASPEGLASHFIINADSTGRKQLTNIGQMFVTEKTVRVPSEMPIWSSDGRYLVYDSDRAIWLNEFDVNQENIINVRMLSYGTDPKWLVDGKTLTVVLTNASKAEESLITIDINGRIIK